MFSLNGTNFLTTANGTPLNATSLGLPGLNLTALNLTTLNATGLGVLPLLGNGSVSGVNRTFITASAIAAALAAAGASFTASVMRLVVLFS